MNDTIASAEILFNGGFFPENEFLKFGIYREVKINYFGVIRESVFIEVYLNNSETDKIRIATQFRSASQFITYFIKRHGDRFKYRNNTEMYLVPEIFKDFSIKDIYDKYDEIKLYIELNK